jgi:type IX secretion system PorP/SprF family membrane protein
MRRILLVLSVLTIAFVSSVNAQQNKILTHFIFDKMSINPGASGVGMDDGFCGTAIYRNQWDRVNGAPNSALLNIEGNLSRYKVHGFGLSFYHDAIGFARQNNVTLNYSYHLNVGNGLLGIGAGLGLVSYGMNPTWVTPDGIPQDNSLPQGVTEANFDANFGLYYKSYDGWYAGISATHLPASQLEQLNFETARHYFAMGGYRYRDAFGVTNFDLDFNALMRTELVKYSADLNVRAIFNNKIWGGFTYRTFDAIGLMAGIDLNGILLGYSYDITTNQLADVSWGSHEIFVRYCHFLPPPPVTKSRNPRYL